MEDWAYQMSLPSINKECTYFLTKLRFRAVICNGRLPEERTVRTSVLRM